MFSRMVLCLGLGVGCGSAALGQDGILGTVAGTGDAGATGDGGPAVQAQLGLITGIAVHTDGTRYFADSTFSVIRTIAADGIITTICGTAGVNGYDGDGGPATAAHISAPEDIVVDANGNLFIADTGNNVVRRIDASSGIITTVAGTGVASYDGPDGPAIEMGLNLPTGLTVDAPGNLYLCDTNNGLIRMVTPDGAMSTRVGDFEQHGQSSGDGGPARQSGLNGPSGIAIAADGTCYILELAGLRIRRVDPSGTITTYAGDGTPGYRGDGGPATSAQFNFDVEHANQLELDPAGTLFIADSANSVVRTVDPSGYIETLAGNGTVGYAGDGQWAFEGQLNTPYSIACQANGDFIVADSGNYRLRGICTGLEIPAGIGIGATASLGDEVTVTFDGITTGVEITIDVRDPNDPALPDNLQVNGQYLDFGISGGTYVGTITVHIAYDPTGMTLAQEQALRVLHYDGSQWVDVTVSVDTDADEIVARVESLSPFAVVLPRAATPPVNFRRGDTNHDGEYDISDGVVTLLHLFAGRPAECADALDANDDGALDVSDAIRLLQWLFLGGNRLPPPGPAALGLDPTGDSLDCSAANG